MASYQHVTAARGFEKKAAKNQPVVHSPVHAILSDLRPACSYPTRHEESQQPRNCRWDCECSKHLACDARLSDITTIATSSPAAAPPMPNPQNAAATIRFSAPAAKQGNAPHAAYST